MKKYSNKVFLCFLTFFFIIITIIAVSYNIFLGIVKEEKTNSMAKEIASLVGDVDELLTDNDSMVRSIKEIDLFSKIKTNSSINEVEYANICEEISNIISTSQNCIENVFIFQENSDYIITRDGTVEKDHFFETFYKNYLYNYNFFLEQLDEQYSTKYLTSAYFKYTGIFSTGDETQKLIPLVSKEYYNSNYLIVIMIDENELRKMIDSDLNDTLLAFSPQGMLLTNDNVAIEDTYDSLDEALDGQTELKFTDEEGNIIYISKSDASGIIYRDFVSKEIINEDILNIYSFPMMLTLLAFIVGGVLSLVVTKILTAPIKDLMTLFERNVQRDSLNDIDFIKNQVGNIMSENNIYSQELENKKNQLTEFLYLSKFRKIYSHNLDSFVKEDEDSQPTEKNMLIYIKINSKDCDYIEEIKNKLGEFLKDQLKYILIMEQYEIIINIIPTERDIKIALQEFFKEIDVCITVVIGREYNKEELSADMYTELARGSRFTELSHETQVINLSEQENIENFYIFFTSRERKELYDGIFSVNQDGVLEIIKMLLIKNKEQGVKNYYLALCCKRIINVCMNTLQDARNGYSSSINIDDVINVFSNLYFFEDYISEMEKFIGLVIADMPNIQRDDDDEVVAKIKKYVADNYQKNFSLENLSENLSISRSYMSTYFKEKTNVNLSTYITNYRIMKSLDLLKSTDMTVQEISDEVGIFNVNTFIRVFKKYIGTTPGSYRKS
ncbi:MAG: AraC family transcriptional regulator [Clostridia bacterium]